MAYISLFLFFLSDLHKCEIEHLGVAKIGNEIKSNEEIRKLNDVILAQNLKLKDDMQKLEHNYITTNGTYLILTFFLTRNCLLFFLAKYEKLVELMSKNSNIHQKNVTSKIKLLQVRKSYYKKDDTIISNHIIFVKSFLIILVIFKMF